jgi:hypothetical protein
MAQKIEIQIEAGTDKLIKSLGEADRAAIKFSGTLTKSFSPIRDAANKASSAISGGFSDAFGTLTKGVAIGNLVSTGILKAASAISNFVSGSLAAAQQQEDAINKLSQALRAQGQFTNAAIRDFEAFASGLQKTTTIGDEVTLSQLAVAKSFGASNEQAKQLVLAAANLSSTFGGSLEERVQQLGKSLTGTAGRLGQFIPELQALTKEQLLAGNAIDIVNKKFAGAASNELNTFSGTLKQLTNQIGDFQEELGFFVTRGQGSVNIIKTLTSGFEAFTNATKNARQALGIGLSPLEQERQKLKELGLEYNNVIDQIKQRQQFAARAAESGNTQREQIFLKQAADLEKRRNEIIKERQTIRSGIRVDGEQAAQNTSGTSGAAIVGDKELAERARINEALKQQRAEFDAFEIQSRLAIDVFTTEQRVLEFERLLEFENQKVEAIRQAELTKAQLIQDEGARKLEIQRANEKAELSQKQNTIKSNIEFDRQLLAAEQKNQQIRITAANNFLNAGLALAKEGSAAQKALAITSAVINTYQAANQALADPLTPPFLKPALAASFVALGLANVARIAGAKFADGGIVGGTSMQGDRVPALLNSREMVLNMSQQRELFNVANGSSRSNSSDVIGAIKELTNSIRSAPIIVQANGREIARLIRDEQRNGFEVLA